jgi:hypothetical protein
LQQPVVIERERAHQIGLAGEDDHADAVIGPFLDERAHGVAHHVDAAEVLAILVVIERLHGRREIDREHDVDAAFLHLRGGIDHLGPCEADEEAGERGIHERGEPAARARPALAHERPEQAEAGILHRGLATEAAAQKGDERNEQQERQRPRISKLEVAHAGTPSTGRVAVTKLTARCWTCSSSSRPG